MHTIETWEQLQARLFHLGWLGEELPAFVATPGGTWLFGEIVREAQAVARITAAYVAEGEKAAMASGNQSTPTIAATPRGTEHADTPTTKATGTDTGTATRGGEAL